MMEELPLSREDEGIMDDVDAMTEWAAGEVQTEATKPLYQPSLKKGALHVTIGMEIQIDSTVGKNATGQTCAPYCLRTNSHS